MQQIHYSGHVIQITRSMTRRQRAVLGALGCFPLIAVYELLWKPRWNWAAFQWDNVAFALIPLAIAGGALFITLAAWKAAWLTPQTTIRVDLRRGDMRVTTSARPLVRATDRRWMLSGLAPCTLRLIQYDGSQSWNLEQPLPHSGRPLLVATFDSEEEARTLLSRLSG